MYEVEVKLRASHEALGPRLERLDAERMGTVDQTDTYYDAPHRSFAETDEALRLRRETRRTERKDGPERESHDSANGPHPLAETRLTYKGPLVESASKTRTEYETAVADGQIADSILRALGFSPAAVVEKRRERYRLNGYAVTLDDVADLGEFVEVERETDGDVDSAREGAFAVVRKLGLDPDDQIRTSYLGLLLERRDGPASPDGAVSDR